MVGEGQPGRAKELGDLFQIIEAHGTWAGTFGTLNLPQLAGDLYWNTSSLYSGGTLTVARIPEPQSAMVVALALLSMLIQRRSKGKTGD